MAEEKATTGERYDVDDIMDKIQDSDLITDNVARRCDVQGTFTTTTRQVCVQTVMLYSAKGLLMIIVRAVFRILFKGGQKYIF